MEREEEQNRNRIKNKTNQPDQVRDRNNLLFDFKYNKDFQYTYDNRLNPNQNMVKSMCHYDNLLNGQRFFNLTKITKDFYIFNNQFINNDGLLVPQSYLLGLDREDMGRVLNSVRKLYVDGYQMKNINIDKLNKRIVVFTDSGNEKFYVSYSKRIIGSKNMVYRYPMSQKVYESFNKKYNMRKYKVKVKDFDTNEHFDLHSIRGITEWFANLDNFDKFDGKFRLTFGENIARAQYMPGVHFLEAQSSYDKHRIEKYKKNSFLCNEFIIDQRFNGQNLRNYVNQDRFDNYLIQSTDALYYNPFISEYTDGMKHRHILNIFRIREGVYEINDKVSYEVKYKEVIKLNDRFVIPQAEDKSKCIIPDYNKRNVFEENKKYSMPYISMKVLGNPETEPYEHPFPMFDGVFLSIDNIEKNQEIFEGYYVTVYNEVKINKDLYYCDFIFEKDNFTNKKFNVINRIIVSDVVIANEDVIELNEKTFYNALMDKTMFDSGRSYACRGINNLVIIRGQNYILQENKFVFDNIFSLMGGKISLNKSDVIIKLEPKYLNTCLSHYRSVEINEKMIQSCTNSLIRLSETEEDIQKLDYFQARTIAILCGQIATSLNIMNVKMCERINEENQDVILNIDKSSRMEKICQKGKNWMEIGKQINGALCDIMRVFSTRKLHWFRQLFNGVDKKIDEGINMILSNEKAVDETFGKIEEILDNKDFKIRNVISKLLMNKNDQINNKIDEILGGYNFQFILMLILFVISLIFNNIIVDFGLIFIFIFYYVSTEFSIKNVLNQIKEFIFSKRYDNFFLNWLYNILEAYFYSMLFIVIYFIFDVCSSLVLHYYNMEFAMEYLIVIFNIMSFVMMVIMALKRCKNTLINVVTFILYVLASYMRMYSINFDIGYINYLFNGVLFIFDMYKFNKVTYANAFISLNRYLFNKGSVKSKFVYEAGTCSLNNLDEILRFLKLLYYCNKNEVEYKNAPEEIKNKYNEKTYKKFSIKKMPRNCKCNHDIARENQFLINHNFQVNGHNVIENVPLKLHKCVRNEAESVYRQIQSGITYDEKIMKEFLLFAKDRIDKMVYDYYVEHTEDKITLEEYYSKIGGRRKEYEGGYEEYVTGGKLKMLYKMHNKDDEKQFLNFNDFKSKSRNICAQLPIGKVILALPCELGMKVIHCQEWCGPGNNLKTRCEKFAKWIRKIGYNCSSLCCDGSSFDSTQHKILIDEIDTYFINKIIDYNPLLNEFFDYSALYKYAGQSKFRIYSKSGFLYDIDGTQLSGRMNTCLCNTLRSALYIEFILYKIGILDKKEIVNFEVNGDDQLIFIHRDFVDTYIDTAKRYVYSDKESNIAHGLGQICKIFDRYDKITGAEYLSCYIIYSSESGKVWMIRKPERFFQLIPFTFRVQNRNREKLDYARNAIGKEIIQGAMIELKGVELYETLLKKYLSLNIKYRCKIRINQALKDRVRKQLEKLKEENYYKNRGDQSFDSEFNEIFHRFLFERFGINDQDIEEYKTEISKVKDIDGEIHVTIIDKLFNKITSPLDFTVKCKHLYENKTYSYSGSSGKKIKDEDFIRN